MNIVTIFYNYYVKKVVLLAALSCVTVLITCFSVAAQGNGYYEPLMDTSGNYYRQNDPFVFCTQGYETNWAQMCWYPTDPITAAWLPTGICRPPNPYGRPWYSRDIQALALYQRVCPRALKPGSWKGHNNLPQNTPFAH
jgi:hypothetical protein